MFFGRGLGREAHRRQTIKTNRTWKRTSMWPYYPPVPPLEQSRLGPFWAVARLPAPGPGGPLACNFGHWQWAWRVLELSFRFCAFVAGGLLELDRQLVLWIANATRHINFRRRTRRS